MKVYKFRFNSSADRKYCFDPTPVKSIAICHLLNWEAQPGNEWHEWHRTRDGGFCTRRSFIGEGTSPTACLLMSGNPLPDRPLLYSRASALWGLPPAPYPQRGPRVPQRGPQSPPLKQLACDFNRCCARYEYMTKKGVFIVATPF